MAVKARFVAHLFATGGHISVTWAGEILTVKFWHIHRATIVNVDYIASVKRGLEDQAEIALRDHTETLVVSRAFTQARDDRFVPLAAVAADGWESRGSGCNPGFTAPRPSGRATLRPPQSALRLGALEWPADAP